jgi:UDP-glucose 4-epimerase
VSSTAFLIAVRHTYVNEADERVCSFVDALRLIAGCETDSGGERWPSVGGERRPVPPPADEERGLDVHASLVENPRSAETLVEEFGVETRVIEDVLGWEPKESVEASIHELLRED